MGGSKEPYCKITLSNYESALGLKPRQRGEFAWAYMSYFFTGEIPELSNAVIPVFRGVVGDADMIISGIVTGGQRQNDGRQHVLDGTANRVWWDSNRRLIDMHSHGTASLPTQYPVSSQPIPSSYPNDGSAATCDFVQQPSDAPSDAPSVPIARAITITTADAEGFGAGVAVEPPAHIGEIDAYFSHEIGHPELAQPFIAEGSRCGWNMRGIEEGWKRAALTFYLNSLGD